MSQVFYAAHWEPTAPPSPQLKILSSLCSAGEWDLQENNTLQLAAGWISYRVNEPFVKLLTSLTFGGGGHGIFAEILHSLFYLKSGSSNCC